MGTAIRADQRLEYRNEKIRSRTCDLKSWKKKKKTRAPRCCEYNIKGIIYVLSYRQQANMFRTDKYLLLSDFISCVKYISIYITINGVFYIFGSGDVVYWFYNDVFFSVCMRTVCRVFV